MNGIEELKKYGIGVDIEKFKCLYCKDKLIITTEYDLCCDGIKYNPMEAYFTAIKEMQKHIKEKHPNKEISMWI